MPYFEILVPNFSFLVVKIDLETPQFELFFLEIGTLQNVGAFFSGRVQNGFQTQNGFTRSSFRGMPSLVPKFAFLVVKIRLRNPLI